MYASQVKGASTVTVADDDRITKSGKIMRRFKLDELPQLINVLLGQMSLVGPRPDVPGYADKLAGHQRVILKLRPGITGPATIKYKNEEAILAEASDPIRFNDEVIFPDKVEINASYYHSYRFQDDVRYILMTLGLHAVPEKLKFSPDHLG